MTQLYEIKPLEWEWYGEELIAECNGRRYAVFESSFGTGYCWSANQHLGEPEKTEEDAKDKAEAYHREFVQNFLNLYCPHCQKTVAFLCSDPGANTERGGLCCDDEPESDSVARKIMDIFKQYPED